MQRVIVPALRRFAPQMIMVASGFDAGAYDPQGRMMLSSACFREMTRLVMSEARRCDDRVLFTHEGGYHRPSVPFLGVAVIEQMAGLRGSVADPFEPLIRGMPYQALQPHQHAVIAKAEQLLDRIGLQRDLP
jgi:acetoin utilization deacetylase AcuC-like enzyme